MTIPLAILAVLSIVGGWVGIPHVLGGANHFEKWLEPVFGHMPAAAQTTHTAHLSIVGNAYASSSVTQAGEGSVEITLMILAVLIGLGGIFIAWLFYVKNPALPKRFVEKQQGLFKLVHNKYFVDEIYSFFFVKGLLKIGTLCKKFVDETIIDGAVNGIASLMSWVGNLIRRVQNGLVQGYAFAMIFGAIVVIGYLITRMLS
jgi:NADH-quinone oxidoreductase subunit L